MKLTPRLKAIAEKIPPGSVIADIGTDHAYLPIFLTKQGTIMRAIGIEKADHPLFNARQQVELAGFTRQIEIRKGQGLDPLEPGEAGIVVIAGMGGKTIIEIMKNSPMHLSKLKRLILQPMNDITEVREWLMSNSWDLVNEDLVREGKMFYSIIEAEPVSPFSQPAHRYSDLEMEIGPLLIRNQHPVLKEYIEVLIAREEKTLASLQKSDRPEIKSLETRVQHRLQELEALSRSYNS